LTLQQTIRRAPGIANNVAQEFVEAIKIFAQEFNDITRILNQDWGEMVLSFNEATGAHEACGSAAAGTEVELIALKNDKEHLQDELKERDLRAQALEKQKEAITNQIDLLMEDLDHKMDEMKNIADKKNSAEDKLTQQKDVFEVSAAA
jgi:chromosome segregation ATPase